ncbi:cell wall hydrolase [Paenibacillus sp. NEAU-GSW1]|uniref:cell wall hydrolase n=1 Tax=Paenibacillus sp. NEAU-GSW1 TaxID=2682486 RepID=UPI0015667F0A|nr:cell wall hydrolase [Paenibacillus sp. NEAU-GSW1]
MMKKTAGMFAIALLAAILTLTGSADASALKLGSSGAAVKDLQERLYMLGYYKGSITSKFSVSTKHAVMAFQGGAGLEKDGAAGTSTMRALRKVTVSRSDLSRLARVVYAEARGESYSGQVAVAAVVLNRSRSPLFPSSVRDVIFAPNAFSAVSNGQFWLLPDDEAFDAAKAAARRVDPSKGAYYFYNPRVTDSTWFESRKVTAKIGNHVFLK